jgi:hypothetical protein
VTDVENAHKRIDGLEMIVKVHAEQLTGLARALDKNTALTQEVADNTSELVTLFKGSKAVYRLLVGVASLAGIIYAAFAFFKGH